jgi:hypothetical protein
MNSQINGRVAAGDLTDDHTVQVLWYLGAWRYSRERRTRCVDLQEIVVGALIEVAPEGGDDPGGHRAAESERVADCDPPTPTLASSLFPHVT